MSQQLPDVSHAVIFTHCDVLSSSVGNYEPTASSLDLFKNPVMLRPEAELSFTHTVYRSWPGHPRVASVRNSQHIAWRSGAVHRSKARTAPCRHDLQALKALKAAANLRILGTSNVILCLFVPCNICNCFNSHSRC